MAVVPLLGSIWATEELVMYDSAPSSRTLTETMPEAESGLLALLDLPVGG